MKSTLEDNFIFLNLLFQALPLSFFTIILYCKLKLMLTTLSKLSGTILLISISLSLRSIAIAEKDNVSQWVNMSH